MKIVVLEASALHLGYFGCYGNDWVATPNLDGLAAEAVVFDRHIADDPAPALKRRPSERSIGTGMYRANSPSPAGLDAIAHVYRALGPLDDFVSRAVAAIDEWHAGNQPLLWLDGPDLNPPWRLPEDLQSAYFDDEDEDAAPLLDPSIGLEPMGIDATYSLQNTYAAALTWFDAQLGQVLNHLEHRDVLEESLLCITASHSLPLGEHGMVGLVRPWLHEELVHVPLIVRLPKAFDGGRRVSALTQPVDLLPTLLEALAMSVPSSLHGVSLCPLLRGEATELRPCAFARLRLGDCEEWLLRTPDWAFVLPRASAAIDEPRTPQLYVKPDDRWEVNDVIQPSPGDAERLEAMLRQFEALTHRPGPIALS